MSTCFQNIQNNTRYSTPNHWQRIRTIDMHTAGEPLRVILSEIPLLKGDNVLGYRTNMKTRHDHIRTALMFEPRGHEDMYGCVLLPPNDASADFGILFLHNEGYSTMCGHAIIAITKLAVEMNWVSTVEPETRIVIDAPCGRITSYAKIEAGRVVSTYFHCVPSFVVALDQQVLVDGIGPVKYDLAYGGAFYAYVDADALGISLEKDNVEEIKSKGMSIKRAVAQGGVKTSHPFEEDLGFLYGTIFIGRSKKSDVHSKNVCVFADGEVDRSPTGSGVAGRMAIHYKRNDMRIGEKIKIESIIGSVFTGSAVEALEFGPYSAIIPEIEGNAFIVGQHEFIIDPTDPLKDGFLLK